MLKKTLGSFSHLGRQKETELKEYIKDMRLDKVIHTSILR